MKSRRNQIELMNKKHQNSWKIKQWCCIDENTKRYEEN